MRGKLVLRALKKYSKPCLINEKEEKIFVDEDYYREKGVKKAYGLDSILVEYTGFNVIKCLSEKKLSLDDVLKLDEKTYRVLEVKEVADIYSEIIFYEDDFTLDCVFSPINMADSATNKAIVDKEIKFDIKGRLRTKHGSGTIELPKAFYGEGAEEETHFVTIQYKEEYSEIKKGWFIQIGNLGFKILSFLNFNESNLFVVFNCARVK